MSAWYRSPLALFAAAVLSTTLSIDAQADSPSGTTIPSSTQIVDSQGNAWTVSGGIIYENGYLAGYSNAVAQLLYLNGVVFQQNGAGNWWSWNGSGWISTGNPLAGNNGVCGTANSLSASSIPTSNLCTSGSASAVAGNGPWYWNCAGSNGGAYANCTAPVQTVNGACGASNNALLSYMPSANLCSAGVPSALAGNGPWYWNCAGANGGTYANCSASYKAGSDITPPSVPAALNATAISTSQINLAWTPSTDDVGVTGYRIYRNGAAVGASANSAYADTTLNSSTLYSYAVSAYDAAGNNSAQSIPVSATTKSAGAALPKLGINIDWITDWGDHALMFVDVMKIARGFAAPSMYWDPVKAPVPVDAAGWPTADFGVVFISNGADPLNRPLTKTFPSMFGTYNLSFTGRATVAGAGCCQVVNTVYDPVKNSTSAQVVVGPNDTLVALTFTNTNGGVQNVKLLRPGYALGTSQVFTTQLQNALGPFGTIRFMTPLLTNNSPVTSWKGRTLATNPTQNTTSGIAWEYVVQLANTTGKDIWINIPDSVDLTDSSPQNYVTQLAQLLKATLNPNIHVYVEYSNEVWNGIFTQFQNNLNSAIKEVGANTDPTLNYDNLGNKYYWALRRTAHQTVRISQLFRNVYGTAAMNNTIRPVLMSQYPQPYFAEDSLIYISTNFGPPNQYVYAIGGAPYFFTTASYADVNGLFTALQQGINDNTLPQFVGGQTYKGVVNWLLPNPTYKTLADYYGLKHVGYEGGIGLGDGVGPNPVVSEQSLSDPRNGPLIQQTLADWYGCGNDLFVYYSLATFPGDYYGLYEDLSIATPKSAAVAKVAATPLSQYTVCSPVLTNQLYVR